MRRPLAVLAIAFLLVFGGGIGFIYSGFYNVSAMEEHWPITRWAMEMTRTRSIKAHAVGIAVPPTPGDPRNLVIGTEHFAAHCAVCHGAPGVPRGDIADGLYPEPADLANAAKFYTPGELFWILKNGIKMTGMPAWSDHSNEELWATVAFMEKLPEMSQPDYAKLVMESMKGGDHHHGGSAATASQGQHDSDGHHH